MENLVTSMTVLLAMFVTTVLQMKKLLSSEPPHQTPFAMELARKDFILAERMALTVVRNVPTVA